MKNNKSGINKYLVIVSLVIVVLLSLSYAYFTLSGGSTDISGGFSDTFEIELLTPNNGYIRAIDVQPILPADVDEYSEKTTFSVHTGDNGRPVSYKLALTELSITENFRVSDFKWALICLDNGCNNNASGSFSSAPQSQMTLLDNIRINPNSTNSYEFRLWIEDNDDNQLGLLQGEFKGRITVISNMVYE